MFYIFRDSISFPAENWWSLRSHSDWEVTGWKSKYYVAALDWVSSHICHFQFTFENACEIACSFRIGKVQLFLLVCFLRYLLPFVLWYIPLHNGCCVCHFDGTLSNRPEMAAVTVSGYWVQLHTKYAATACCDLYQLSSFKVCVFPVKPGVTLTWPAHIYQVPNPPKIFCA